MALGNKGLFSRIGSAWEQFVSKDDEEITIKKGKGVSASWPGSGFYGTSKVVFAGSFNGEKNFGEMGPVKYFLMDYVALSLRSWQAYVESSVAQTILNKFTTWVIGTGLKLQSEPVMAILSSKNDALKNFSDEVEARWQVYANSTFADHSRKQTLNEKAAEAFKNAIVGGDVLVILRVDEDAECVTVQLVDGNHLTSPWAGSEWFPIIAANGNRLMNGVEIDDKGQHVAYYVRKPFDSGTPWNRWEVERIPARNTKKGILRAFLVYGLTYRLDTQRGIPLLTAVLEKLKKMERYEEATLAAAEEQSKIAYQITHELGGAGDMPFAAQIAAAHNADSPGDLPVTDDGRELANKVIATTNKQVINNTPGSEVKPLRDNKGQLYFEPFLTKNTDIVCATVEMPPNVAMSKYDSNYSASRAAIKDWEHTLKVKRASFSRQFYQNVFNFFLELEILKNNIQAPGYLIAKAAGDYMVLEAYRTCRWVGAPVANIDPVKEVQAERLKLGITAESIPLTTIEASTELLGGGDSDHNMEQYAEELEKSKGLGLRPEPEVTQTSVVSDK
jgi:lambda family phage portal protein